MWVRRVPIMHGDIYCVKDNWTISACHENVLKCAKDRQIMSVCQEISHLALVLAPACTINVTPICNVFLISYVLQLTHILVPTHSMKLTVQDVVQSWCWVTSDSQNGDILKTQSTSYHEDRVVCFGKSCTSKTNDVYSTTPYPEPNAQLFPKHTQMKERQAPILP